MNKMTLTIGIPAHNEGQNIDKLLRSIMLQDKQNYILDTIYVVADGCTDNTVAVAKRAIADCPEITVIDDNMRVGKSERLNMLYQMNKSDIYMTLDADVVLGSKNVLNEIVYLFKNKKVDLVGANVRPFQSEGFFERIAVAWLDVWHEAKREVNDGVTVNNHLGCASAMSSKLASEMHIPKSIVSDDDYIYFTAYKLGYKFAFAEKAVIYYRAATTMKDFFMQHARLITLKDKVAAHLGTWIYPFYAVPRKNKFIALKKVFLRDPIFLSLSIVFQVLLLITKDYFKKDYNGGLWTTAKSSKNNKLSLQTLL